MLLTFSRKDYGKLPILKCMVVKCTVNWTTDLAFEVALTKLGTTHSH